MATLKRYANRPGYFITQCYPIRGRTSGEDHVFGTLQVHPRAENFFEAASYRNGQVIEKDVFYALLLDGDIASPSSKTERISFDCVPKGAVKLGPARDITYQLHVSRFPTCRYLVDFYRALQSLGEEKGAKELAARLCLAKHARQAEFERTGRSRRVEVGKPTIQGSERTGKQRCPSCQRPFWSREALIAHEKEIHSGARVATKTVHQPESLTPCADGGGATVGVKCTLCATWLLNRPDLLDRHIREQHPQVLSQLIASKFR